jgi:hypothetical protein
MSAPTCEPSSRNVIRNRSGRPAGAVDRFYQRGGLGRLIVGPILGGFLYDQWGYTPAVFSSLLMAFAAFLIALLALP